MDTGGRLGAASGSSSTSKMLSRSWMQERILNRLVPTAVKTSSGASSYRPQGDEAIPPVPAVRSWVCCTVAMVPIRPTRGWDGLGGGGRGVDKVGKHHHPSVLNIVHLSVHCNNSLQGVYIIFVSKFRSRFRVISCIMLDFRNETNAEML